MHNGKPSVLHVINCARMGGGMGHLLGLFQNIDREKYHVVLAADRGDYRIDAIRQMDIPIHTVPMMQSRIDPRPAWHISKIAWAEGADIIHCHGTRAAYFSALAKPFCPGKKSVYTLHALSFHKDMAQGGELFYLNVEKMLGKAHDWLVSVSEFDRSEAVKRGVCKSERICTIPNAIDFDSFDPSTVNGHFRAELGISPDVPVVGTAARLVRQKGIDYFIKAARLIRKERQDIRFAIIGEGEMNDPLQRRARQEGLQDAMIFTGPRDKMPEVYAGLNVFVLASLWEGHPLSLIEALAMERPTVATRTSGSPEIIDDGESGLLVPPKDPKSLADAILRLLNDPAFAKRLGKQGRHQVKSRYSFSEMMNQTENVYRNLLQPEIKV